VKQNRGGTTIRERLTAIVTVQTSLSPQKVLRKASPQRFPKPYEKQSRECISGTKTGFSGGGKTNPRSRISNFRNHSNPESSPGQQRYPSGLHSLWQFLFHSLKLRLLFCFHHLAETTRSSVKAHSKQTFTIIRKSNRLFTSEKNERRIPPLTCAAKRRYNPCATSTDIRKNIHAIHFHMRNNVFFSADELPASHRGRAAQDGYWRALLLV